jgi:hypothetical protein
MYKPSATIEEISEPEVISKKKLDLKSKNEFHNISKESSDIQAPVPTSESPKKMEAVDKFAVKLVLVPKNEKQQEIREVKEEITDEKPDLMSEEQKQRVLEFLEKSEIDEKENEVESKNIFIEKFVAIVLMQ